MATSKLFCTFVHFIICKLIHIYIINMKINKVLMIAASFAFITACGAGSKKENHNMGKEKRTQVKLETTMGNITVELYNETPKHRDNFIKLAKEGVYDSTLFHRVIKQFMVQAGDPTSKTASDTAMLGNGDVGYTIPAEFVPKFFHHKGVLAAAREGDNVNPQKASSGCQFYIVTGRKFTEPQLLGMENKINEQREEAIFDSLAQKHMKEIYKCVKPVTRKDYMPCKIPSKPKHRPWRIKKKNSISLPNRFKLIPLWEVRLIWTARILYSVK